MTLSLVNRPANSVTASLTDVPRDLVLIIRCTNNLAMCTDYSISTNKIIARTYVCLQACPNSCMSM